MRIPRALGSALALSLLAACGVGGTSAAGGSKEVVVASHDSWAMSKKVLAAFTRQTGYRVSVQENGDVGQLTNKLVLTKGAPIADMVYGIDNTFASRAVDAGILSPYRPKHLAPSVQRFALTDARSAARLTPVDYADVCVNVDNRWFAAHHLAPPASLDDLTKPAYRNLFVTPAASTSSPGLAFLLATIAKYGAGWTSYWKRLMANGTEITTGWNDAYEVDFTAGGGDGKRPIVLSYNSSPPDTIPKGGRRPTTSALLDTCFRQVEYAGVLAGAHDPAGATAFIDFMEQRAFQQALPGEMYVFPVDTRTPIPPEWARWAKVPPHPYALPPAEIAAKRMSWLRTWGDITSQ